MTLPFGTMLEVTNLANKRFVIVRINDRGPYKPGRIIDLTENPAKWLKMRKDGLTDVRLKVVGFDGDIIRNTLHSFLNENPFLVEQAILKNTYKNIHQESFQQNPRFSWRIVITPLTTR